MKHWLLPEDHIREEIQDKNGTFYTPIFSLASSLHSLCSLLSAFLEAAISPEATKNPRIKDDFNTVYPVNTLSEE